MVIQQGDIFWVELGAARGSGPAGRRPVVVVQNDAFNRSLIGTVVVCAVTSNLARGASPGNVVLGKGEGGLPKRSVVNVTQIATIDKGALGEKAGTLSKRRVREVVEGIGVVVGPVG